MRANLIGVGLSSAKNLVIAAALSVLSVHLASADKLNIATDVWLPYENISNTEAPGFSTEIIQAVMQNMTVEIEIREFPWARGLKDVYEGNADALYSAFWTKERAEFCHFPEEPLNLEKWVFFVRTDDAERLAFSSYQELHDKRIGILRGASVTKEFWEMVRGFENYEEVETDELNLKKLYNKRIDYVVTSYSNGIMLAQSLGLGNDVRALPTPVIKEDSLYIMFSKRTITEEFVSEFSNQLESFKNSQDFQVIWEKYFGTQL